MWMDRKATIEGEPVQLASEIYLNTNFHEMGARWVMFSVRNVTWDGSDPVWIEVERFASEHGDIVTTREDRSHNEIDLWVDVMDLPVQSTITIEMTVGSTERGAFMLESIMVVFDRGYEGIYDSNGEAVDLFASTHLGVKEPTDGSSSGLTSRFQNIPGPGIIAVVLAAGLAAVVYIRRREK